MKKCFTMFYLLILLAPVVAFASDDVNLCLFDRTPTSENIFLPVDDGSHFPSFWTGDPDRDNMYDDENGMEYTFKNWSWTAYPVHGGPPVEFAGFAVPVAFYTRSPFADNEPAWIRVLMLNFVGPDGENHHYVYMAPGEFEHYENAYDHIIGGPGETAVFQATETGIVPVADPTVQIVRMFGSGGTDITTDIVTDDGFIEVHTQAESLKSPHYLFDDGYDPEFRFMYERSRLVSRGRFKFGDEEYYVVGTGNEIRQWQISLQELFKYQWFWSTFQIRGCLTPNGKKIPCGESMREISLWSAWTMDKGELTIHYWNEQGAPPFCEQTTMSQQEDWSVTPMDFWVSPHTGIKYARVVRATAPSRDIDLYITALIDDQEIYKAAFMFPGYWEGAVEITGTINGNRVWGSGNLEQWNRTP